MNDYLENIYSPSYPCKTISNFLYNIYNYEYYDDVKNIVFRIKKIESSVDQNIFDLNIIFQYFHCMYLYSSWDDYIEMFYRLYNYYPSNIVNEFVNRDNDIYYKIYDFCYLKMNDVKETFLLYLYLQNLLTCEFKYYILLPSTLFEKCKNITDKKVGFYFLKAWFKDLYKKENIDLKNNVINSILTLQNQLNNLGVISCYIFGSINKNMYHKYSDIDLIIKGETIAIKNYNEIIELLRSYLFNLFQRNVDVHLYNEYLNTKELKDSYKIF